MVIISASSLKLHGSIFGCGHKNVLCFGKSETKEIALMEIETGKSKCYYDDEFLSRKEADELLTICRGLSLTEHPTFKCSFG